MDYENYYVHLAAAFVRGKLGLCGVDDDQAMLLGRERGLSIHNFKRTSLPRVQKVLGFLRGVMPLGVLDIGSGRGAFLWPLLDSFEHLPTTAIDISQRRVDDMQAVHEGGVSHLNARVMDVCQLEFPDTSVDVVTALEVIEHLERPDLACREIVRVARRFAVFSVPSRSDDNPQHLQLFDRDTLTGMLEQAGARSVDSMYVLGHLIALAKV